MSANLLESFALLAASDGGVAKLRELILSLAVRGKLVPQDPADEPASELLKRIRAEKERLVTEGKIKREKVLPAIGEEEKPFELPDSWEWVRLQTAYDVRDGTHDSPKYLSSGIPFLTSKNIFTGQLDFSDVKYISTQDHNLFSQRSRVDEDDILFAMIGSIGNPTIVNTDIEFSFKNMALFKYYSRALSNPRYLLLFLSVVSKTLKERAAGGVQSFVPLNALRNTPIPIPPLPEQSRIVAKVEALMALCDRLEAQQGEAARVQAHWTQAALDQLAESGDADEFARNWQALADHFDTLFATPASIDALDATLLQLAVRGKLVPQNAADEPASELLKHIRAEKDRLIATGQIKRDKPLPPIADDEKPFELPEGWEWARINEIPKNVENAITDGPFGANLKTEHYIDSPGYRVIRLQNIGHGEFISHHVAFLEKSHFDGLSKHHVMEGDIVVAGLVDEGIRCCVVPKAACPALVKADCYRFSVHEKVSTQYASIYLNSRAAGELATLHHHGLTLTRIGLGNFRNIPVPLPPAAEQSRIVAKLEELLALTRTLRARIKDARAVQARLASALVDEVAA